MERYYDIRRTDAQTLQTEPRPVFSITGRDARHAKDKANRELLRTGRNRGFDLARTVAA